MSDKNREEEIVDLDTGQSIKVSKDDQEVSKDGVITSNLVIKHELKIVVPMYIRKIMNGLNDIFTMSEFSIFCKTKWDRRAEMFVIDDEYYIPKQEVSAAHIDYHEDPGLEYNTVLHRHPEGCASFSGTDEMYINANFRFSLLWTNRSIVKAIATMPAGDYGFFVRLKLTPTDESVLSTEIITGLDNINIKKRQVMIHPSGAQAFLGAGFGQGGVGYRPPGLRRVGSNSHTIVPGRPLDPDDEFEDEEVDDTTLEEIEKAIWDQPNLEIRDLEPDDEFVDDEEEIDEFDIGPIELGCEIEADNDDCVALGDFRDGCKLGDD